MYTGEALDGMILHPGQNTLCFHVRPLKRGLYCVKGVQGRLGHLRLDMPMVMSHEIPGVAVWGSTQYPTKDGTCWNGMVVDSLTAYFCFLTHNTWEC